MESKKNIFEENKDKIIFLFKNDFPITEIEKEVNLSRHTIKKYLNKLGYKRTKEEVYKIVQKSKVDSLVKKYGVVNVSQIDDPEMQERRIKGVKRRRSGSWSGKENPNYKNKIGNNYGYKFGRREDLDCFFRSSWESNFARFLNYKNIKWEYEPKHFKLYDGRTYTPDFLLIKENKYIEIKGYWRDDAREKFDLFKEQYPEVVIELIETKKYKQIIKENKNNINFE